LACTEEILAQLYDAQRKIATGTNVVKVVIDGEETSFGIGNPSLLAALISGCESELNSEEVADSFFRIPTSKGFGS